MAAARSFLRDWSEYLAVRAMLASMAAGPLPLAFALGRLYAGLLDRCVPRLRRVAFQNLSAAFLELSTAQKQNTVNQLYRSIGRLFTTFARLPRIDRDQVDRWLRYEGFEHVSAGLARGRGVLFATGHVGNWELSAFAFALLTEPMHIVVRPLDNSLIDRLVTRYRSLSGNQSISKREFARGILAALHRNHTVGMLVDQNADPGVFVNFFGRPASTSPSFARIAAHSGAAVIPGFALWSDEERKYVLRFYPEVPMSGDALVDTQRVQNSIEQVIREYPDQWLWIHRRWKTQPPV